MGGGAAALVVDVVAGCERRRQTCPSHSREAQQATLTALDVTRVVDVVVELGATKVLELELDGSFRQGAREQKVSDESV